MTHRNTLDFATRCVHAGQENDPTTGAVMTPIYATSTYAQSSPGVLRRQRVALTDRASMDKDERQRGSVAP